MTLGEVSRDECLVLNELLGAKAPSGCFALGHNQGDPFTYPNAKPFKGEDESRHRNSWLWPKLARRLTKGSEYHVSNWRKAVEVDRAECEAIHQALKDKLGEAEASLKLPKACK
mmetsp:Transcript_30304/g.61803  ORF Transcript_30304/g.61803 Transcript_30304/m.61803 type:complete len:114 (-) Transcript_30304:264-605(-)|eukprot:CAMPEP_0183300670 /NCGR_PEP_ID=MMETSP0160_2-20130417/7014_1 /TAXON_ID=2839 ORGANISM="Odontella Sinensis, Strain Grunow 1884" /NCGR_SAMPLE_ID=MMETSP0160_2 /ASSEMBLY_ACC=CAM_ASM_000250 /LENGTH=113 /DNA_ID=CAMNT_0025463129 /DNA_START=67 /DNA_END=408 /DNA_ORIENTATION=-